MKQDFDKTIRIPVITDLVRGGDPKIIAQSHNPHAKQQRRAAFEQRLRDRISELQAATGQDEYAGLARAHAIRSESNKNIPLANTQIDPAFERHIDKARDELIRELSSLLK
ncbi:MAG: hypothetical protein BWK73_26045 [Thiothrix lacustris]|jgi:hypothetical protein|uniref:Uncharacterized protein n=2 Tax=Thiothrix TaxID=1030 RepID=A0A975IHQ9_9GAMM|nr:hypothetical protein [Thiothrix unzii]OQX08215.1 MAG: hypothetical protein BWK73_26045 [Thiothrix lacustris]QTR54172.1 hypothetical protein J9260_03495 [Thiothrix unzii]